jgi:hypothetical protein
LLRGKFRVVSFPFEKVPLYFAFAVEGTCGATLRVGVWLCRL